MLAGAMMTVGSGAMAGDLAYATDGVSAANGDKAKVAVTYNSTDVVNITLKWNNLTTFEYSWDGSNWLLKTEQQNGQDIEFTAINKGFSDRTVSMTSDTNDDITWLTVSLKNKADNGEGTVEAKDNEGVALGLGSTNGGTESTVAKYHVAPTPSVGSSVFTEAGSNKNAGNLSFTVAIN